MVDFNKAASDINLRDPSCRYCGKHEFEFDNLPKGVHWALPLYHMKNKKGAHMGVIVRGCKTCGHFEMFAEVPFRKFLGVEPFKHEKPEGKK